MAAQTAEVGCHTGTIEEIGFGLVVFERAGDRVDVTVRGITANLDPELLVFETTHVASITTVASPAQGRTGEYTLHTTVEVGPSTRIVVEGRHCGEDTIESIAVADLPDGMPVVCTDDPTSVGLPERFLHRRGDAYVLMSVDTDGARPPHRATMVA